MLFSCATKKDVREIPVVIEENNKNIGCLSYKIPDDMEDSQTEAYKYRFDNLVLEKGTSFFDSSIIIAIKIVQNINEHTLKEFVEQDQTNLKSRVKLLDEVKWIPQGFDKKTIDYSAYEFAYIIQGQKIYQRSIYIQCRDKIYIISLNSLYKEKILDEKNNEFWESVNIN